MPESFHGAIRIALTGACVVAACLVSHAEPVPANEFLSERARVRLRTVDLRIEPTRRGAPGACLELGLDDLRVKLRRKRLPRERLIELERERRPTVHALLIDTSQSMGGKLEHSRRAAMDYVRQLRLDHESAMLLTFDDSVVLVHATTRDRKALQRAIESVRLGAATRLLDGLYYTMRDLEPRRERGVILVLTDGVDAGSIHERDDVLRVAEERPDLTVFSIGLELPPLQALYPGYLSTRRFLQNLARYNRGAFFDVPMVDGLDRTFRRIREMLDNEATLTLVDPDPEAAPGKVKVGSLDPDCRIRVLGERSPTGDSWLARDAVEIPPGFPQTLDYPLGETYGEFFLETPRDYVDPQCAGRHGDETRWFIDVSPPGLRGCGLDVMMDHGALFSSDSVGGRQINHWIELGTRPFEIPLPDPGELPEAPEATMDELARIASSLVGHDPPPDWRQLPERKHARRFHDNPSLQQGRTLLDDREVLARAIYTHPAYRSWVRERLDAEARQELTALEQRFRRYVPDATDAQIESALRDSSEGRAIRARRATPTEPDLVRYLTAWLGDIAAHDLFVRWERQKLNERIQREPMDGERFEREWVELRRFFYVPSYTRILTLLRPVHDPQRDRIGFWRVVLPRASWMLPRLKGYTRHPDLSDLPLDLIPDRPFAYRALERAFEDAALAAHLRARGYRVEQVRYELEGKPRKRTPGQAFFHARVIIELVAPAESGSSPRARLVAAVERGREQSTSELSGLAFEVQGDPRLRTLVTQSAAIACQPPVGRRMTGSEP